MHNVFKIQSSGGVRNLVYGNHSTQGTERFLGVSRSQYKCHLKCHFLWISGPTKTAYPQKKEKKQPQQYTSGSAAYGWKSPLEASPSSPS